MNIALLFTGNELLKGSTVNTNLAFLGETLTAAGLPPALELCTGDAPERICGAVAEAMHAAETLVVCGGLGPTADDLTLACVSRFFGKKLAMDDALRAKIEAYWHSRRIDHPAKSQYKQAMVPEGAEVLSNPRGTASGIFFRCDYAGKLRNVFLLPGPPREFCPMVREELLPRLKRLAGTDAIITRGFLASGMGESLLSKIVAPIIAPFPVEFGCTAKAEGCALFLSGRDPAAVDQAIEAARAGIGAQALPSGVLHLAPYVLDLLKAKHLTLTTAESCTGGTIGKQLTAVPGSSEVYLGGAITYSNELKHRLLGVPEETLETAGAVSEETAFAMASGACSRLGSDCAVAVTGIAGPGGGTPEKPVGLVYIAAQVSGKARCLRCLFSGDRETVRERSTAAALNLLREELSSC